MGTDLRPAAARKDFGDPGAGPSGDGRLEAGWRSRIARDLHGLGEAWQDPQAWEGMTEAGGVPLPGGMAGLFALDELVIHGWDVARASRQPYDCDEASLQAVRTLVAPFAEPGQGPPNEGIFGPLEAFAGE